MVCVKTISLANKSTCTCTYLHISLCVCVCVCVIHLVINIIYSQKPVSVSTSGSMYYITIGNPSMCVLGTLDSLL